jgi:hypothetical protein
MNLSPSAASRSLSNESTVSNASLPYPPAETTSKILESNADTDGNSRRRSPIFGT